MAIHALPWHEAPPAGCRGGALSVGNFDGVHRGHVALLEELRRQAGAVHGPAVALTFDPHPLQLLRPDSYPPPLMRKLLQLKYTGYVGQEFIPTRNPTDGLRQAVKLCDV